MLNQDKNIDFDRRKLISRMGKAGFSIAGASTIYWLLYDSKGPKADSQKGKLVAYKDFSVTKESGRSMSIVKGPDRVKTVGKAIELLGGIERFVKKGEVVAIKPNVAFASPPILSATSNPALIAEVVRLCYKAGARKVYVTDNSINAPQSCFALSGIGPAAKNAGAEIILPRDNLFKNTTLNGGRLIRNWPVLFEPINNADKLIGIAVVKNHSRSGASMLMKNWYGLLGGRRNIFHQDINTIISELAMMVKPTLVILDGTEVMMTNGPTGGSVSDLRRANTLIASCDMVAADSYACSLLDMKVGDLPYLKMAENAGAGTTDYQAIKPITASIG